MGMGYSRLGVALAALLLLFAPAVNSDGPVYSMTSPPSVGASCAASPPLVDESNHRVYVCESSVWKIRDLPECNASPPTSPSCAANAKPVCILTSVDPPQIWGCNSSNAWTQIGGGGGGGDSVYVDGVGLDGANFVNSTEMDFQGDAGPSPDTVVAVLRATSVVGGKLANNTITATQLDSTLTFGSGDFLDLSAIPATTVNTGLKLPQTTNCSLASATNGQVCWDNDTFKFYIGNGTAYQEVGGGGTGDITRVGDCLANDCFNGGLDQQLCFGDDATDDQVCLQSTGSTWATDYAITVPGITGNMCVGANTCGTWSTGLDTDQNGTNAWLERTTPAGSIDAELDLNGDAVNEFGVRRITTSGTSLFQFADGTCTGTCPNLGWYCFSSSTATLYACDGGAGAWAAMGGGGSSHNILSATHSDSLTGTVVRGDIVYGNSTPKWARLAKGSTGQCLTSNATDVLWGSCGGSPTWATSGIDSDANGTNVALSLVGASDWFTVNADEDGTADVVLFDPRTVDSDGNGTADLDITAGGIGGRHGDGTNSQRFAIFPGGLSSDPFDYTAGYVLESLPDGGGAFYPIVSDPNFQSLSLPAAVDLGTTTNKWRNAYFSNQMYVGTGFFTNSGFSNTYESYPIFWNSGGGQVWKTDSDYDDSATRKYDWTWQTGVSTTVTAMHLDGDATPEFWVDVDGDGTPDIRFDGTDEPAHLESLTWDGTANAARWAVPKYGLLSSWHRENIAASGTVQMSPVDAATNTYLPIAPAATIVSLACTNSAIITAGTITFTVYNGTSATDVTVQQTTSTGSGAVLTDTACTSNCSLSAGGRLRIDAAAAGTVAPTTTDPNCSVVITVP